MGWLQGILGLFGFIGKLFGWIQQKKHDELVVKAESAKRAEDALKAAQQAEKDRHAIDDDIARAAPDDNRDRLSKWASPDNRR